MITIQNVSKKLLKVGVQDYELKINNKLINTFQHSREEGLAICLKKAAIAASDKIIEDCIKQLASQTNFFED